MRRTETTVLAAANSASGFATRETVPQLVNSGLSAVAGSRGTSEYLNSLRKNYNPPFSGLEVISLGAEVENGPVSVRQVDTGTASPQAMFPNVAVALGSVRAGDGLGAVPSGADPRDAGSEEPPAYEGEQMAGGLLAGAEDESAPPAAREQGRSIKWNFDFAADGAELDGAVGAHVMDWVQLFSRDF